MNQPLILVIDDEPIIRANLAEFLQQVRFTVHTASTGELGLQMLARQKYDAVLCDVNLPGLDGLDVLDRATKISPETFIVLITAYATVESAVDAFHRGAHDYLVKPIILKDVERKLRRLLEQQELARENQRLRRELNRILDPGDMVVGGTPALRDVMAIAKKTARTSGTVLLAGESGTGKELLARWIHAASQEGKKVEGRFVPVNCAAIPAENGEAILFGHADAATIFLDEVGELPLPVQAQLLRAIELKDSTPTGSREPVRLAARIIAATNKDLPVEVEAGRFRDDLFYRLNVVSLKLPPLRDRREDIPDLVDHLLAKHAKSLGKPLSGATHEAIQALRAAKWKGNIRELDNALQRAAILCDGPVIGLTDLPPDLAPHEDDPSAVDELGPAVERFEKRHIERMLRQTSDKREAARRLGIAPSSLYRKIEQYGIG